ncbi:MAG: hypothetical protein U1E05_05800 [Patescibacteria group bacterium]|nr:hypothetical protein [Patescibacteria group bacterium]
MPRLLTLTAGLVLIALGASAAWFAAGRGGAGRDGEGRGGMVTPRAIPPVAVLAESARPTAEQAPTGSVPAEQVPAEQVLMGEHSATDDPPTTATENHRRILGTWQDDHRGRRTMTVRADGTATMVCELEGLNARLFTPVLHLNLHWQLADGVMTRVIIDGEPADKVRFVVNLMGARSDEKLLLLTDGELHLLDADGQTEYRWTRVAPNAGKPPHP